jgi:hypothetical protein
MSSIVNALINRAEDEIVENESSQALEFPLHGLPIYRCFFEIEK